MNATQKFVLKFLLIVVSVLGTQFVNASQTDLQKQLNKYNVRWTSQSKNSGESMPLGGGDMGLNVWVENGDLLFYLSRSGTFDENNQLLKLGRGRIRLSPNIFAEPGCTFNQELKLYDGNIIVTAKTANQEVRINLWVDVFKPIVNIDIETRLPVTATAYYESWRTDDRFLPMNERSACFSYSAYPGDVTTYRDSIRSGKNEIVWFHRNRPDKLVFDFCVRQQGLEQFKPLLSNPQKNLTFGGMLSGKNMVNAQSGNGTYVNTPFSYWSIQSKKADKHHQIKYILHSSQAESIAQWENELKDISWSFQDKKDWEKTREWWHRFWERSYIFVNNETVQTTHKVWQTGRNYQLFRYQLGCNARGKYPTKFNGGLFTFDPVFVQENIPGSPDFRAWGGGSHTAQNQRLVYWPMLKSGDFDMMAPQFDFYRNGLKNVEMATKYYWGHEGCAFTEHPETFGLPAAATWGFDSGPRKRPADTEPGILANRYVCHHHANQLEFTFMLLEYNRFTGNDISPYLPFMKSALRFFDEHYQLRHKQQTGRPLDENGKLVFYPSTAAEMYKIAKNPVDVIAGLKAILPRMVDLPATFISETEKDYYRGYLQRLPDISFDTKEGHRVIKPAESWEYVANMEIPELYPLFPYGLFSLEKGNIEVAKNTFFYGESNEKRNFTVCWSQVGIFASRLGLVDEAVRLVTDKLADAPRRFPSFWGPGPDWVPDTDHGGAGMINLQEMLLQTVGEKIYLLPAWPKDWDVDFKLHAPENTVISCKVENGKIIRLQITPESRRKDLIINPEF